MATLGYRLQPDDAIRPEAEFQCDIAGMPDRFYWQATMNEGQLLNEDENTVVNIQNNDLNEQLAMINQLDDDEKNALIKIINSMLTKKRMKDLLPTLSVFSTNPF